MSLLSSVGTLQAEIATRLNEVSADEADTYLGWINSTIYDIGNQLNNIRMLETSADRTLSSGIRIYTLPSDYNAMYSVINPANDTKLSYVTKQEFDALQPSATESGIPTRYTIYGENIEFYPSPNSSLTMHYSYLKTFTTVSAASAALPVSNQFLEAFVYRGVQLGMERRGDFIQAAILERRYQAMIAKMNQDFKSVEMKRIKSVREFGPKGSSDPIVNAIWNG